MAQNRKITILIVVVTCLIIGAWLAYSMFYTGLEKPYPPSATGWYEASRRPISRLWGQGIAFDGVYWYFSGRQYLCKTYLNYSIIIENRNPIPEELKKQGYDHIGDIDYFEGIIYAPVEDYRYKNGTFVLYFAENLTYTGKYIKTSQSHMPWCAIDPETQLLYSSEFDNVRSLYVYDLKKDFRRLKDLPLSQTLHRVQGGTIHNGLLYLSCDDFGERIYIVDIKTGKVLDSFATNIGWEMEGITIYRFENASLGILHFIDHGKNIYHYSFKEAAG